jgi:hypothetical protein
VPPVFELAEEFKGYRIGVKANSSDAYFSKQFDPESQHPKDVFPVGGKRRHETRARGAQVRRRLPAFRSPRSPGASSATSVPFKIEPITGSMGGVSQRSGVEVDGWWYQWDELRGPYRTNLETWESLSDNRIQTILGTINRAALKFVEVVHYRTLNIIASGDPDDQHPAAHAGPVQLPAGTLAPPDHRLRVRGAHGIHDALGRLRRLLRRRVGPRLRAVLR